MKKTYTITALTLAFGLMFTTSKAEAGFRISFGKTIRVGNQIVTPRISFGTGGTRVRVHSQNIHNHFEPRGHAHGHIHFCRAIDQFAVRLERDAKNVLHEVHAHFRYTPQYKHLDHDVHEMVELAEHIHDVAHRNGSRAHILADVRKLDRLFYHVEQLVDQMRHCRGLDYRAYRHLRIELSRMEQSLHGLLRLVR